MVQIIKADSWEVFESKIAKLQEKQAENPGLYGKLLFRGQSDSGWPLATTLERNAPIGMEFREYYRTISWIKSEIETFTGNKWDAPEYGEIDRLVQEYDKFSLAMTFGRFPAYGYMAHLRHHGFPSPLLDWTHSVYVAAYFAFRHAQEGNVSIYALSEARSHTGSQGEPRVHRMGPNVKTHRRHFLQQSEYTMCLVFDSDNEWEFSSHELAIRNEDHIEEEHPFNFAIHRFDLPASERLKVLALLDGYNLNAYSLFGSEESLMDTLSMREFQLRKQ